MARQGMTVDRTIVVDRLGVDEVTQRLLHAVGGDGVYRAAPVGPFTYQLLRTFRPAWSVVTGWVTTVLLLGAGLLFFLVKRTESCTVTVAGGRRGATVNLAGRILPAVLVELESALNEPIDLTVFDVATPTEAQAGPGPAVIDPAISAPAPAPAPAIAPVPWPANAPPPSAPALALAPWPSAAPPPPAPPDARRDATTGPDDDDPTIALRRVPPMQDSRRAAARRWVLAFDGGLRAPVDGAVLVGRDPVPMVAADEGARLLRIQDPSMSVSRTHLALGIGVDGPWVEDRGSTNGSAVVDRAGSATPLAPGVRYVLASGAVVVFGARRVELQEA